jgi:hypothetical protein
MKLANSVQAFGSTLALLHCSAVNAQERPAGFEPLVVARDSNGVDLLSGAITFPSPTLSIPADPLLSFSRIQDYSLVLTGTIVSTSNFVQILQAMNAGNSTLAEQLISQSIQPRTVKIFAQVGDTVSEAFDCSDGDCSTRAPVKSYMLDGSGSGYFLYRQGGTGKEVVFNLRYAATQSSAGAQFSYYGSQIKYPNGEIHELEYDLAQLPGPPNVTLNVRRPAKVKSNRGYELRISYISQDPYNVNWTTPASAAIYRRGEYTTSLSSITFQSAGQTTDQLGKVWRGSFQNSMGVPARIPAGSYRPPTNTADQITATSAATDSKGNLLTTLNKAGNVWNYAWSHAPVGSTAASPYGARNVIVTGPNSYYRKVNITDGALTFPKITSEIDGLNRTTTYGYTGKQLTSITYPEGNSDNITYDLIGNITQHQKVAKPGSGLASITETATYSTDPNCQTETYFHCFKPLRVTDGKGNQTDYTWDMVHGGLLTETLPAQPNGVRPQKRIEYVERFAWYKNDSGTFIRSPTGIWLKSKERTCRTTATVGNACAGGAGDEVITEYDYGPDAAPNNLFLRGMAITAANTSNIVETQRTCYTYDVLGRKISETQPLGTGSTCP